MRNWFRSKLQKALLLLALVMTFGVFGYMTISGYTFVNALYMTVITISTVGFGEIEPLSDQEKLFTVFLIATSIVSFGYTVSAFTEYIVSGQLFQQLKLKKVQKKIEKLEGHTIICGFGRNGSQAMLKLENYKQEFVIIEQNEEITLKADRKGLFNVHGDATTDDVLKRAGIERLQLNGAALGHNLFVVLTARQLNQNCKIISRASNESYDKLKLQVLIM